MKKSFLAATAATLLAMAGSAQAATLTGTFDVKAVNITDVDQFQSQATMANFNAALLSGVSDDFTYVGSLDFSTKVGAATTVASWLATGVANSVGGSVTDLDPTLAGKQLSKGNVFVTPGTATTTFFLFTLTSFLDRSDFTVEHDDGIALFDDDVQIGGFLGPNSVRTTEVKGFNGGEFSLLYVATNSDPSILNVDVAPVPLPAALPLLAVALGGLGLMRLRRKAA
jgi:hypothetical protein